MPAAIQFSAGHKPHAPAEKSPSLPRPSCLLALAREELLETGVELLGILIGHEVAAHHVGRGLRELLVAERLGHVGPVLGDVHEGGHGLRGGLCHVQVVAEDRVAEQLARDSVRHAAAHVHEVLVLFGRKPALTPRHASVTPECQTPQDVR